MNTFHLFDAIAQDQVVISEDEDTKECYYTSGDDDGSDESIVGKKKKKSTANSNTSEYVIHLFGCNTEGKTIRLEVTGFEPFFYIGFNTDNKTNFSTFKNHFENTLSNKKYIKPNSIKITKCIKKRLYGYHGDKTYTVAEIRVKNKKDFYSVRKMFLDEKNEPIYKLIRGEPCLPVYDALLDPMLRFFHMRNIQPCGWISVPNTIDFEDDNGISVGTCHWEDCSPSENKGKAPVSELFWDIECYSETGEFPVPEKDPVIQIGNVLVKQGIRAIEKTIFVLGSCDPIEGITVVSCKDEKTLFLKWFDYLEKRNPDIMSGYNVFGFDERYIWGRISKLGITNHSSFQSLNRLKSIGSSLILEEKMLTSSALGDNKLYILKTCGRLQIDLYHYIKRNNTELQSYKLDSVCQYYMSGKLQKVDTDTNTSLLNTWYIKTKQTKDVIVGRYISLIDESGEALVEKLQVVSIEHSDENTKGLYVKIPDDANEVIESGDLNTVVKWAVVKDDVSPAEIFKLHRGSASDRAKVAAYCIQDCDLVYELYKKLDVFNNAMSMANVCSVPVTYIFTRGQGIKIESLIYKECLERGIIVDVLRSTTAEESLDSYEGAIVLHPKAGFYTNSPIGVCDFASLYPSTIISENISYDSLVWVKEFNNDLKFQKYSCGSEEDELNAPIGTRWTDIEFDILRPDPADKRKNPEKIKVGTRVCRYAQKSDGTKHTLPDIVSKLLATRKQKRKEAEKETDLFRKALLDAEQLAYKLTANSLYGQLGSSMFKVRLQHLAASVTSYGRKQILFAKSAIENFYGSDANDPRCSAKVIYGDTDSLFVDFGVKNPKTGLLLKGTEAIQATMDITEEAGKFITRALKAPHDFEYDKIFDQFIIFSKKRYVGNKYEDSATEFKQNFMGIVLKRRDNAPILKTIYGGAIKILLNDTDSLTKVQKAAKFVMNKTMELVNGNVSLSQLTITKSLRSEYKTPNPPAHRILADRMRSRDPGSAPAPGERLGYVYVNGMPGQLAPKLQGERIETPDFIRKNNLDPDYKYYIQHQLQNPLGQLFGTMVDTLGIDISKEKNELLTGKIDTEYYIKIIEIKVIQYLFTNALNECDKKAIRAFGNTFFGKASVSEIIPNEMITPNVIPIPNNISSTTTSIPKKQTTIESYFVTKTAIEEISRVKDKDKKEKTKKEKEDLKLKETDKKLKEKEKDNKIKELEQKINKNKI